MSRLVSLAVRNVLRQRRRSLLTLLAIASGMTLLVGLRGLADGFARLVVDAVAEGRVGALQVHRAGHLARQEALPLDSAIDDSAALRARIRAVPGVRAVSGRVLFGGFASDGAAQVPVVALAVEPGLVREACPRWGADLVPGGRDLAPGDRDVALAGLGLAQGFHLAPGTGRDGLTLSAAGPGGRVNAVDLRLAGVAETSFRFENRRLLYLPLETAQRLLGLRGRVTEYVVGVERIEELPRVAGALRAALGPELEVHTWEQLQPFMAESVKRQVAIVWIAGIVFFVVIVAGISNAMVASVYDRTREIGTLLALGMRRRSIRALLLLEAALLGLAGGVAGAALGKALVAVAALRGIALEQVLSPGTTMMRPLVSWSFLPAVAALATLVAVCAAALPAWRVARRSPAEALRG